LNVCVRAELGDFASADAAIEEQLRLSREIGDLEMQGCAPHDLGMIHFERSLKLTEPYLLAALEVFKKLELQTGLAFTKLNLIPVKELRMSKSHAPKIILVERTRSIFLRIQMRKF
jgi:hypothetical protein